MLFNTVMPFILLWANSIKLLQQNEPDKLAGFKRMFFFQLYCLLITAIYRNGQIESTMKRQI